MTQLDILNSLLDGYPYRVLVVDDDPVHRTLERAILEAPKYAVTEVASGPEALAALGGGVFDVILLDRRMPGMDGDEVCRRISGQADLAMIPILMVTGDSDDETMRASLGAGASDFIRKPYNPVELLARLDAAVRHKRLTDQLDSAEAMLFALARMVEAKDETTGDHCSRLSHSGVVLGEALGLGAEELMALRRGGVLHDIGKLGIPDGILLKPDRLTPEEWSVMRQHTEIGARLVGGLKSMRLTVPIVRHHHERWDGSGYPDGLKGEETPLLARIFQVLDIYDALRHARSYKPAMSREEAMRTLADEAARGWRDPEITAVFLDILRRRPEDIETPAAGEDLGSALFGEIVASGVPDWNGGA